MATKIVLTNTERLYLMRICGEDRDTDPEYNKKMKAKITRLIDKLRSGR